MANAYFASNTIIDSLYDGVGFSTSTNIVFQYNTIINPGLDGHCGGAAVPGSGVIGQCDHQFQFRDRTQRGPVPPSPTPGSLITPPLCR